MKKQRVAQKKLKSALLTLTLASVLQSCNPSSSGSEASSNSSNSCLAKTMSSNSATMSYGFQTNDDLFLDVIEQNANTLSVYTNNNSQDQKPAQTRVVKIDVDEFKQRLLNRRSNKFHLPLLNNKSVTIDLQSVKKYSENNIVVTGKIENDELSHVTLVINQSVMIANIDEISTQESYEIRFTNNGIHTVKEFTHEHDGDCLTVDGENVPNMVQLLRAEEAQVQITAMSAAPIIDVLVAYTPAALRNAGGLAAMKALIQMGVADSNIAYQNSGVNLTLRLVGMMALSQPENSFTSDLSALKGTNDGKWDAVHAERQRVGADLVSVVAYYPNS